MKKLLLLALGLFLIMAIAPQNSRAYIINDNYYGADDHGYGDVIGDDWRFDIDCMEITTTGSTMTVDIRTTFDQKQDYPSGAPVLFGDLFISTDGWSPAGTSPYLTDNMLNSDAEDWEYAFHLQVGEDPLNYTKGTDYTGKLYSISDSDINASYAPSGWTWRDNQEVTINPPEGGVDGSWSYTGGGSGAYGHLVMEFGIPTSWNLNNLGFHWGPTCANDVIEGGAPIPEPATMLLLGSGLIGLAGFRKKFKRS